MVARLFHALSVRIASVDENSGTPNGRIRHRLADANLLMLFEAAADRGDHGAMLELLKKIGFSSEELEAASEAWWRAVGERAAEATIVRVHPVRLIVRSKRLFLS
jgi:hypothetical protein